jgi:hypothetical protein
MLLKEEDTSIEERVLKLDYPKIGRAIFIKYFN